MKDTNAPASMFPDDAKEFLQRNAEGSYVLLDVRQPFEYEEAHLPGARLIPLPRLADSLAEIDPRKPVLVYCAVGGRSRMAAQLLTHQGFTNVFHLEGGIQAWEDPTAKGPVEFHLQFVRGDESPEEIIQLAYRMEEGLKKFHQSVRERTDEREFARLLDSLIKAEESHERTLLSLLPHEDDKDKMLETLSQKADKDLMEGGMDIADFMKRNERFLHSVSGYLELAMMIETQALDLYLRMAHESTHENTKHVLLQIGNEEKGHLTLLARYMEQQGTSEK